MFSMFNMDKPASIVFFVSILIGLIFLITVVTVDSMKRKKAERLKAEKIKSLNPQEIENIRNELIKTARNSITFTVGEELQDPVGKTHFGGVPDVPPDFVWHTFECTTFDDKEVKPRHLDFLMQIDLEQIAEFDADNLLPHEGLLSFFHVIDAEDTVTAKKIWIVCVCFGLKTKPCLNPLKFPMNLNVKILSPQ